MEGTRVVEGGIVYLPTYDGCYVCGQEHPRGLRLRFFADAGQRVLVRFRPEDTQTGYDDIVHGGVISALLDELAGWTVSLSHDRLAYTAELTVRFLKPMRAHREYVASARMGVGRGRCWEAEGRIEDEEGVVYAKGRGKYFLLSPEQTAAVARRMTYAPGDLPVFREAGRRKAGGSPTGSAAMGGVTPARRSRAGAGPAPCP